MCKNSIRMVGGRGHSKRVKTTIKEILVIDKLFEGNYLLDYSLENWIKNKLITGTSNNETISF